MREAYERAVLNMPLSREKEHWRRYIYLWLNYAMFEESKDIECGQRVLEGALEKVPHQNFTFSKLWIALAEVFLRERDLPAARKVLG